MYGCTLCVKVIDVTKLPRLEKTAKKQQTPFPPGKSVFLDDVFNQIGVSV